MATLTVREALRDAMAEEMRADPLVFLMGEEVAEYQGAYKISQGLSTSSARRGSSTRPSRKRDSPASASARLRGFAPHRRVHDLQFRHAGNRPAVNSAGKTLYMTGGVRAARSCFAAPTARPPGSRPSIPSATRAGTARSRASRSSPLFRGRRQGIAEIGDPRSEPGRLSRERAALRPELRGSRGRRPSRAHRRGWRAALRRRRHDRRVLAHGRPRARRRRNPGGRGHRGRGYRPAQHSPARQRHDLASVRRTHRLVTVEEGWGLPDRRRDRSPRDGTRVR